MNIAVLFGGISPERNVSIAGGKAVVEALTQLGHNVFPIDPAYGENSLIPIEKIIIPNNSHPTPEELAQFHTKNYIECINSKIFDEIDAAFLVLHGQNGEDGKIQALLECRGIPYTGSGIKASALSIDKISSKMIFYAVGILTPQWHIFRKKDLEDYEYLEQIRSELGEILVIKPNDQGSTIGISIIDNGNLDDIHNAIINAFYYSDLVLIEEFIEGRELTVGIVGNQTLPIIEIVPESGFYDYYHKYKPGKTEYLCPADIPQDIAEFTQNLAFSAFNALGCSGFARADFRMNEEGQVFLLEMNTIPGFTATSLVPKAAKAIGIEFTELCQKLIDIALEKNK